MPSVYAQPVLTAPLEDSPALRARPPLWIALTALAAVLGAMSWLWPWQVMPKSAPLPNPPPAALPVAEVLHPEPVSEQPLDDVPEEMTEDLPPPENRVVDRLDLPEKIRSTLPTVVIHGSIYSDDPAERILMINKETYRMGDEVAPGLLLENVESGSAVFAYNGYRYRMAY